MQRRSSSSTAADFPPPLTENQMHKQLMDEVQSFSRRVASENYERAVLEKANQERLQT